MSKISAGKTPMLGDGVHGGVSSAVSGPHAMMIQSCAHLGLLPCSTCVSRWPHSMEASSLEKPCFSEVAEAAWAL
jgi:hypothetical protein